MSKTVNATALREDGTYASNNNNEYDYALRYIAEAIDFKTKKIAFTTRAIEAYKGFPSVDGYITAIDAYANLFESSDPDKSRDIRAKCKSVKSQKNMTVMRAIDSMVSQAQGGVSQFECAPYDPTFEKTPELVDALDAAAMDFYQKNHIDSILAPMLEWAGLSGSAYAYLNYNKERPLDSGRIDLDIIPDTEMLIDPVGSKRNRPRYIGHQTKASWVEFKDKLVKCEKCDEWCLKSINEVDAYLEEVNYWISKYNGNFSAIAPAIRNDAGAHYTGTLYGTWFMENLPTHIDTFYKASALAWNERSTKYNKHMGGSEGQEDDKYRADEVEVCYLYDLKNHIQFTVINRKFIVEAKKNYLQVNMPYTYFEIDEYSGKAVDLEGSKKISVDHPYVELSYKKSLWEAYSYTPLIHVLDLFDSLCALETMIYHTISVMTPITFTGNPKDIEKLGAIAGVSGEAIKGFIANSVTVLNKAVDLSPAMSEISRIENTIMGILHGVDPKEQSQMIGNRATAAEAMQAASLVSQGLNSLLSNIESWASDLATKMFKLTVIYEPEDFTYDLSSAGRHITLTRKDLAGDFGVHAVLKSKIKAEQQAQAAITTQWFVPLMQSEYIVNKEAYVQSIVPTLASGFTRKTISSWFQPTEEQRAAQEAQLELQKQQAQALAARNNAGIDYSYIDPTSGGQYGAADISRAISAPDEGDYSAEPAPVGGASRPTNTSRSLNYGLTEQAPDNVAAPTAYDPNTAASAGDLAFSEPASPTEDVEGEGASDSTMQALLSPTTGGQYANNGLTGANSPYMTGNY